MASPNPFSSSPYAQLAAEQDELARVQQPAPATPAAMPDATSAQPTPAAAQPVAQPEAAPAPHRRADNYLPPADLRGVFDASAQEYGVPVNALMALAHQESRYNPNAVGSETQWGRAKGIMQYLDGTAKGLGINPFDPNEAIPAAAKQLRERLDQGYSLEDAVKEHFAGPDSKKWGVKTAAYGQEVMGKVGRIGDVLMGEPASASANTNAGPDLAALQQQLDADEPGRYKVLPAGYDLTHFTTAMPRDVYQQTFMETNPGASPAAVDYAMGQYDQQAQQRAAQTPAADRFKTLQSPEATFDARLNKKLQGAPNGVVPPLPGKMEGQPAAPVPEFDAAAANRESTLDAAASYLGKSLKSGMYDLAGAGAKVLDEINPWTLTPSDAAVLFKNDPAKLKQFQDDSAAMVLSRFANSMTKGSEQAMTEVSPRAKRDYGSLEYATTDLSKAAYTSPTKVIGDVVRSLPTTVAMALSVYLTRGAAARAEQTALAAGMTPEMARQAAVAAGAKTMATAGAASEGVTGYAQQANQSASDAAKVPMTELAKSPKFQQLLQQGFTPETARAKIIADTGEQAGQIAGIVDAAVNHVGGEFLGKILTEGGKLIPRIMKGAANEAATEFVQSGGEQAGQNVATRQNINPNQSLTEGVGEAAVAGGVAGAVMGGVASGAGGQGHVAAQPAPAAEAPAAAPRPLPASQVQPVPSSAVPAAPSATPLTSAVENAAAQPQRVVVTNAEGTSATGTVQHYQETKDGGFEAAIVGDDGQVYTITDEDGVQLTPVANEPGPLTAAVEAAAEHHAVAPEVPDAQAHAEIAEAQPVAQPEAAQEVQQQAATPAEPEPAPAPRAEPPKPVDLTDAQLRERLQNIASQAKGAGRDQRFIAARREVEAEINRRAKAQEAANAPQVSDTGGNVGGRSDSAAARNGTDLGGRPGADRPLPGNGSTDAGLDAGQAAADRPAASAAADAQPALRDKHAKQIFPTEEQVSAYLARQKIGATHRVEQTGRVRYEIRPKAKPAVDWQGKVDKQQAALEAQIAVANANAAARKTAKADAAPAAGRGHETSVRINNEKVGAHWEVVEAKDLNATIGKAENQYRDRTRAASQAQIGQIANAPAFDMLADSPVMDYGAPTLAKDGKTIIGGNGRFAGLVRAYEQGTAGDYRSELEANAQRYGVNTQGMQHPVLVRRFADDVNIKEAAIASNEGGGLKMSALEQAKVDAERMGDMADFIVGDNGDVNNAANQRFIRSFMGRMPQNQQASFVDADGKLSQEGIQRIRNAVLYRAYGDSPTLTRMVESADPGLRNVVTALLRVAPKIADVKARIADGDLHDLDISGDLIAAVEQLNKLRSEGTTIDDYINQLGLFGDTVSDEVASILRYMDANTRSAKAIADFLGAYYDGVLAVGSPKQDNMFGAAAVPTRQEIINEKAKRQAGDAAKQNDIFANQDAGGKPESKSQGARTAEASDGGKEVAARYSVNDDDYRDEHTAPQRDSGAPLSDLTGEGTIYPDDVYSTKGLRYYGTGHAADSEAFRIANRVRNKPDAEVTIYRAVPKDVDAEIDPGNWVSITKQYAEDHGESRFDGDYKILTKKVKASDIFTNGDSIQEWGYDPEPVAADSAPTLADVRKAWDDAGIKHAISERNGVISLSQVIVPKDERSTGKGTAAMQQLVDYADQSGQRIVLSPSADFGGNKARLVKFYKRFGFVENKGRNKDYEVSETMYREPQEKPAPRYSVKDGVPQAEFGPVHTEYRNDVAGAVSRLMADKDGEAIVHRADLGDISLVYGDEQAGLEHIARRRGTDFMDRLPGLLKDGLLYSKPGQKDRVFLGTDSDEAVLRLQWDGKAKTWLLSAYEKYPDLKPASEVEQSRRSQTVDERSAKVMDKNDLRRAVTQGVLGKVIGSMIDAGVVVLHDKPSQLPRELGTNVKGVQAVTTPDGKIHLVASNLTPQNARAVMLHEAFHEGTEKLLGQEKWAKLMGRAGSLYRQAEGSSGRAREVFDRARARVAAAKAKGAVPTRLEVEEFAAYTIEEYERAPDSLPAAMRKWVEDLIGTVKAWLVKRFDKQLGEVTPAQLAAYAKWAVLDHAAARRGEIFGDKGTWFSVAANVTDTPAFKKWFAKSQVVDENGQPLVVYHGTNTDFTTFKPGSTEWTNGIFFTDSQRVAADVYAGGKDQFNAEGLRAKLGAMSDAEIEKVMERARNTVRGFDYYEDFSDDYVDVRKDFVDYLGSEFDPAEGLGQKVDRVMDEFGVAPRAAAAGANVIPAYVSLKNPLVIDAKGDAFDHEQQSEWFRKAKAGGHDGIIIKNYEDGGFGSADTFSSAGKHTVYVAFKPEQVKSAIGNNSDFDPVNPDIRYSVNAAAEGAPGADVASNVATDVARAEPQSIIPEKQGLMRRAQATVQDKFNRVREVQDQIMRAKGLDSLPENTDAYLAEANRPGSIAAGIEDGERERFNPLMERLGKSGYTQEQLEELLHAMHAKERNDTIADIEGASPNGSGMKTKDAAEILERYKDDAELHALADQARAITKKTLAMKLKYERIDQEYYDTLTKHYKYYVPLKGDAGYETAGGGKSGSGFGAAIKRAMGHGEREENILANIRRDHDQAITTGEQNVAKKALGRLILSHPEPDLWTASVAPKGRRVAQEGQHYVVYRDGMRLGEFKSETEANRQAELWAAMGRDHIMNYEVQQEAGGDKLQEFVKPLQDNEFVAYFKGHPVRFQLHDPDLVRQIRPVMNNPDVLSWVVNQMRGLNRWKAVIYTGKNPVFIPKNMARDAMTGTINMTGNYGIATAAKAWTHYPAAFAAMFNYARTGKSPDKVGSDGVITNYLTEYRHHGGKVGASHMGDLEQHTKTLTRMFEDAKGAISYLNEGRAGKAAWVASRKALSALGHAVEIVNQAAENALRLALYTTLREQGVSPGKAAQAAKTVTVDFDRKGEATGLMSAAYLFINPAIQGTANMVNTMAHGKHKQQAWGLVGALALAGMAAAGAGMDDDKDRWLGTSWDARTKNLVLHFGGRRISIPISQEYAPFYAFGVAMAEAKRGESAMKTSARLLSSFIDAYFPLQGAFIPESDNHAADLAMSTIPSAVRPHVETAFNRNSFGTQIVPENENTKNRPDNLKMSRPTKNTVYDKAAQAIAAGPIMAGLAGKYENDFSKVSPETLKHLWRTYAGGLGQFIADSASVTAMMGSEPGQVEVNDVPIVKEFVKNPDFKPLRSRYYELAREAESAATEFQQARKAGDGEAADKIINDGNKASLVKLGSFVTKINKATAAMEDQKVDINADPKLGPAEKRAKLKEIEQAEEQLYRQAIGVFQK